LKALKDILASKRNFSLLGHGV